MCLCVNETATAEIYTLSRHDALPIWPQARQLQRRLGLRLRRRPQARPGDLEDRRAEGLEGHQRSVEDDRSEEHTSELQSRQYLVCRLLLEKKTTLHLHARSLSLPSAL